MATACDPLLGGEGCQQLWVSADEGLCLANASVTCGAVSQRLSNCSAPDDVGGGWGIFVSILCDIFISVGLALQVRVAAARERVFALPISTSLLHKLVVAQMQSSQATPPDGTLRARDDKNSHVASFDYYKGI